MCQQKVTHVLRRLLSKVRVDKEVDICICRVFKGHHPSDVLSVRHLDATVIKLFDIDTCWFVEMFLQVRWDVVGFGLGDADCDARSTGRKVNYIYTAIGLRVFFVLGLISRPCRRWHSYLLLAAKKTPSPP